MNNLFSINWEDVTKQRKGIKLIYSKNAEKKRYSIGNNSSNGKYNNTSDFQEKRLSIS